MHPFRRSAFSSFTFSLVFNELRIDNSCPGRSRRRWLRFLVIFRPAVFLWFLPDDEGLGANHGTTFDGDKARRRIDVESDCALQPTG